MSDPVRRIASDLARAANLPTPADRRDFIAGFLTYWGGAAPEEGWNECHSKAWRWGFHRARDERLKRKEVAR